jgi:hypothetical protein
MLKENYCKVLSASFVLKYEGEGIDASVRRLGELNTCSQCSSLTYSWAVAYKEVLEAKMHTKARRHKEKCACTLLL